MVLCGSGRVSTKYIFFCGFNFRDNSADNKPVGPAPTIIISSLVEFFNNKSLGELLITLFSIFIVIFCDIYIYNIHIKKLINNFSGISFLKII